MKKQSYVIIVLIIIFLCICFWWLALRPNFDRRECYKKAEKMKQIEIGVDNGIREIDMNIIPENEIQAKILQAKISASRDYDKYFMDNYNICLMEKGLK